MGIHHPHLPGRTPTQTLGPRQAHAFVSTNRLVTREWYQWILNPQTLSLQTQTLTNTGASVDGSYYLTTQVSNFNLTIPNDCETFIINSVIGTLALGTITMPSDPADGQKVRICCNATITTLTLNANTTINASQSVQNAPTTFVASTTGPMGLEFIYAAGNSTWYRRL